MPTIVTDDGQVVSDFKLATVQTKTKLDDQDEQWANVPFVWCDTLKRAVNAYDEADLTRFIGDMVQPGSDHFDDYQPLDLLGKFVKITIPQDEEDPPVEPIEWVGFVVGTAKERSAVKPGAPDNKLTGKTQSLKAVGLEYFLDRVQIDRSFVYEDERILRVIPFNGGQGVALDADTRTRANRSADVNDDEVYTFVPASETGQLWTSTQIIKYLLNYFSPVNSADEPAPVPFELEADDEVLLDGIAPTLNPDGMTLFQVLNKLLAPQRGYVWWLEFDDGAFADLRKARIRVETVATNTISLLSLGSIPANRDQQSLDFDGERDVDNVVVAEMGSRIYHQIVCRGARMTCTGTLGNVNSASIHELISDWQIEPEDFEAEYLHAAADTTAYDVLNEAEQKDRNDAYRQAERFYRVFSAFRIDPDWDGMSGDGADGERHIMFAELSDNGSVVGGLNFSPNGLRILNHTRLKRGWDYEIGSSPVETTPQGTEAEYMPLFAIFKVSTPDESAEVEQHDKYQFAHALNDSEFSAGDPVSDNISVSYHLHAQQTAPGIILNAAGAQHACALNHWDSAEPTNTAPQVDYETLRLTCTLEADTYCEARYPIDADLPANVPLQKLLLYVGDEYRLDFLAQNSVVDLRNGEPVLTSGAVLRDDRKRLADIAKTAYEWYKLDRRPLTVKFRNLRNLWRLGMLITTIGSGSTQENVNTVVSIITYDTNHGNITIETHDAALDSGKLA
jgi:hypothetical protein